MAILIYRHSFNNAQWQNKLENQLSSSATINGMGGFISQLVAVDITSANADDTDGTNLADFMQSLGFTLVTAGGAKILDPITHWGSFEVADAPATGVTAGDLGYTPNGDAGNPANCYYDGTNWVVFGGANHGTIIAIS